MKPSELIRPCCDHCRHTAGSPCRDLIDCIKEGPICHESSECKNLRADRLSRIRRGGEEMIIFLGTGTCGLANGAAHVAKTINKFLISHGIKAKLVEVGCVGYCQKEVFVDFLLGDYPRLSYCEVTPDNAEELLTEIFLNKNLKNRFLLGKWAGREGFLEDVPLIQDIPFFSRQTKVVLDNCGSLDPSSLDAALASGTFQSTARMLKEMTPLDVCQVITDSGLRGRGGAGFPTGQKWQVAYDTISAEKYLICNADEGDPGAFMDRAILEGDPFRVLEGMIIAAYAIGAQKGYIYCRAEYPLAITRLQGAINQLRAVGLLGKNILDSLISFDIVIKQGAGAFVCGEETAILASIEGGRGMPRPRPPYPAVSGLHGKPTILNNVETLANVPLIMSKGAAWFKGISNGASTGTKVFALSGAIQNTGLVEVAIGVSLNEILYDIGGGPLPGHKFKAVQIGGPSGGCIPEDRFDVKVDYASLREQGAMMGSGGMVVMDETSCMVDVAKFFMEFIRNESCGKCTPCREGTIRMYEILSSMTEKPVGDEIRRLERFRGIFHLEELAETCLATSLCGLGQTAANPVMSTLRFFRHEYEAHIMDHNCPAGVCRALRSFIIDTELCIGCTLCQAKCPSNAIVGEKKKAHYIIHDRCIGCGVCVDVCPKQVILAKPYVLPEQEPALAPRSVRN